MYCDTVCFRAVIIEYVECCIGFLKELLLFSENWCILTLDARPHTQISRLVGLLSKGGDLLN